MTTLTVELPDALDERLAQAAERERLTKSEMARKAVQDYLARCAPPTREYLAGHVRQHGQPAPESFAAQAARYIGVAGGGPPDLSTNPEHLEGFGK